LKIINFLEMDFFIAKRNRFIEKIFDRSIIQKIIPGFVNNIGAVNKKKKIPVALLVEI